MLTPQFAASHPPQHAREAVLTEIFIKVRAYFGTALLAGFSLLSNAPAHADLLHDIQRTGKIRIGIAGSVPPFNYEDAHGQLIGSDPDVAGLLAQDLGVKLEVIRVPNSKRISALRKHRTDLIISSLSITPEREREIAFSVPYARIALVIAAPKPYKLASILDLSGKTVGVLANSANLTHLHRNAIHTKLLEYPENDKLRAAYLAGEFEIISAPATIVAQINSQNPKHPLINQFSLMEFDVAVGMPSGEKNLRNWVNHWVSENLRNGRLNKIYQKHHGQDLPSDLRPIAQTD